MTSGDRPREHMTIAVEPRQVVLSPEQVELQLPIAGPSTRMLAYAIDQALILVIEIGLFVAVVLGSSMPAWLADTFHEAGKGIADAAQQHEPNTALLLLLGLFVIVQLGFEVVYFTAAELSSGGRSIGKRIVKLRVVRDGGLPITLRESLVRNLLRAVDILPANYVVGLVAMILSTEGKRLGDLAAGTIVIRLDRSPVVEPLAFDPLPDDPPFRFERAQVLRLGARETTLLRQTLRRVGELPPERARELVARTTEVLCRRIGHGEVAESDRLPFLRALLRVATRGL